MTTIPNYTATMTPIRLGGRATLSISFDFTDLGTLTPASIQALRSQIGQVILQWWDSLTAMQKSVLSAPGLSLSISGRHHQLTGPVYNPEG